MENITHQTYVNSNIRLNELIDIVTDEIESNDPIAIEFLEITSIIKTYEKIHFPVF
ncbi:hypothetical protein [Flavobacterium yafengii]|uniref:Uncharacterized protein n=1 Tax=Flavobacterium yafengii TaxID=3041253 RepID=A0AAW6TV09_9FLAO|nr:hypothetical protein [Flavobacterium yafengii]MDI5951275.1 hypothetical protein [Flavobacterium yafengii]